MAALTSPGHAAVIILGVAFIGMVLIAAHMLKARAFTLFAAVALVAACFTIANDAQAACTTQDAWSGADKNKHFAVGALTAAAVTTATRSELAGFSAGVALGLAKEGYDVRHPLSHTCSAQDAAVTAMGAGLGARVGGLVLVPLRDGVELVWFKRF